MHRKNLMGNKSLVSEIIYPTIIQHENLMLPAFDVMKLISAAHTLRPAVASGWLDDRDSEGFEAARCQHAGYRR